MLTKEQSAALKAPFAPEAVSWRVQKSQGTSAQVLAYIDARDVMDRLDEVVGAENWCFDWEPIVVEGGQVKVAKGKLSLFESAPKCDVGDSGTIEATKSAISDALKRSAVHWGVGRYLYELEAETVQLVNGKIPAHELKRLQALLSGEKPAPRDDDRLASLREGFALLGYIGSAWNEQCLQATRLTKEHVLQHGFTAAELDKIAQRLKLLQDGEARRQKAQEAS